MQTNIGDTLKTWRKKANMNQRDASCQLFVDFSYLSKIENDHLIPSVDLIERMAHLYGRDIEEADQACISRDALPGWVKAVIINNPELLNILWEHHNYTRTPGRQRQE